MLQTQVMEEQPPKMLGQPISKSPTIIFALVKISSYIQFMNRFLPCEFANFQTDNLWFVDSLQTDTCKTHAVACTQQPDDMPSPIRCPLMLAAADSITTISDETTAISCTCCGNLPANKTGWIWSFCRFKPPPQGVSLVWFFCFFFPEIVLVMI
jgi:hypothetical protein